MAREIFKTEPELKLFQGYAIEIDIYWKDNFITDEMDTYLLGYFKLNDKWHIVASSKADNNRLFEPVEIGKDEKGDLLLGEINLYPILLRALSTAQSQSKKIDIIKVTK